MVSLAATLVGLSFAADTPPKERHTPTQPFMRQKLNYFQGVLEGLTLERYDLLLTNATLLRSMNFTNTFFALGNPNYMANITNFQDRVDALINAAKDNDQQKTADAYSQTVGSCLHCHKTFRAEQFRKNGGSN